ncbi:hypothetical protein HGA92_03255 [Candidatus Gracilibacteria bacterium]|nr:hypothetical protein [Candidatus Gracilibacteria bacterium]NUJ99115.1 hypothetical protein [Candidatus Gracilibacteria bacterium]
MKEKTKEYIEEKENFLLQNITLISFSIIGIILFLFFYQQIFCIINNIFNINYSPKTISLEFAITTIGAIIAFWYGYKKYERDKDIEMIDKLTKFKLSNLEDISNLELGIKLYNKGYISDFIWDIVDNRNKKIIYLTLRNELTSNNIENITMIISIFYTYDGIVRKYLEEKIDYFINYTDEMIKIFEKNKNESEKNIYKKLNNGFKALKETINKTDEKLKYLPH